MANFFKKILAKYKHLIKMIIFLDNIKQFRFFKLDKSRLSSLN